MNEDTRNKLVPGKLNNLQTAPYPKGDKPLDPRIIWLLLQVRRGFLITAAAIETVVDEENKRY